MKQSVFPTFTALFVRDFLLTYLPQMNGNILNIGSGSRTHRDLLVSEAFFVAVDIKAYSDTDIQASVYQLPFPDETFSAVIATELLEHLKEPRQAISEIHRVLKPGGVLLLTVPFLFRVHGDPEDYYRYTKQGLEAMVEDCFQGEVLTCGNRLTVMMDLLSTSNTKWHIGKALRVFNRPLFCLVKRIRNSCMPSSIQARLAKL